MGVFLEENDLKDVATAPKIYREFTTKKVLTMERLRGVSMLDANEISKITSNNPESIIITALNVWTTSVMKMPWFHADVHAGNLLVLKDGRVGFIDFGIVGRVGEKTFKAVNKLSGALASSDYEGMALALCNMGATDEQDDIKKVLLDIVDVTENNGLKLPREFGLLVKQSLYFDRYLKILAPEIDVMNDARVSGLIDSTDVEAVEAELIT